MPDFTYDGPGVRFYTEGRDAQGRNLGEVEPGDIRDLERAPDQWWHETTDEAGQAPGADGGTGSGPVPPSAPAPVPVPAAPGQ